MGSYKEREREKERESACHQVEHLVETEAKDPCYSQHSPFSGDLRRGSDGPTSVWPSEVETLRHLGLVALHCVTWS